MRITSRKRGILMVSFGSAHEGAQDALSGLERNIEANFPGWEIFKAITSGQIRQKLQQAGKPVFSPVEALSVMDALHFTEVIVLSLHIIPGEEYHSLKNSIEKFRKDIPGIQSLRLSRPLLYSHEDMLEVTSVLTGILPDGLNEADAVILMGHGTQHPSNIYYPAFQYYLWKLAPRYWMATIEGYPALTDILPDLKRQKTGKVWLVPFLSVAGKHALEDMAGNKPDSWKKLLEAEGYEVRTVIKGLIEYEPFLQLWIKRLSEAIKP